MDSVVTMVRLQVLLLVRSADGSRRCDRNVASRMHSYDRRADVASPRHLPVVHHSIAEMSAVGIGEFRLRACALRTSAVMKLHRPTH